PAAMLDRPARWRAAGTMGWAEGGAAAVLRTGPLRFRPGQSDLLHLSLRDGTEWVVRDGGTGSYDPPAAWWRAALWDAAAHNAPVFDDAEPMPRLSRFLLARWPRLSALPDGAASRDFRGNRLARHLRVSDRAWTVEDRIAGPFRRVAWHWRLCPGDWRRTPDGVAGPRAVIAVQADAPLRLALVAGWESASYGTIAPAPVLRVEAAAPVARIVTRIRLP
ncbi:heparinase II/III domain-containing protein, partial [Falsiroseomonas oryzae]|uniref:heparinase II/III domain-containing protein n=1 Tax=Falsiroseomonas oryzae TaxID=2766473 RepID=UPI0022EB1422